MNFEQLKTIGLPQNEQLKAIKKDVADKPEYKAFIAEKGAQLVAAHATCEQRFARVIATTDYENIGPSELDRDAAPIQLGKTATLLTGPGTVFAVVHQRHIEETKTRPVQSVFTTDFEFNADFGGSETTNIASERFGNRRALPFMPPADWTKEELEDAFRFYVPVIERTVQTLEMLEKALGLESQPVIQFEFAPSSQR